MEFKHYRKNVRHGRMSQKSYKRWVMNDGVDPEDGDGGQQNKGWGQQKNRQENGAGGQVDKQVDRGRDNQRVRGRGRGRGF